MDGAPPFAGDRRLSIRVAGQVQGVGFRPHVHRIATRRGVSGFVLNDAQGVLIEAQGSALPAFLEDLTACAPRLARIASVETEEIAPLGDARGFEIRSSCGGGPLATVTPPDAAICQPCVTELFDPTDRRRLHPFISCADCGPRFTITRAAPYDRAQTTMAAFAMCAACAAEYGDPASRRFHAEPIACPDCGPRLSAPIAEIAARIAAGGIVALKGVGGFHLICDARDAEAVARLRAGKQRDGKPFAVMCLNLASARRLAQVCPAAEAALSGHERPVVILDAATANAEADGGAPPLAPAVSAGSPTLGVMLAYAPVHHLLFHALLGAPAGADWLDAPNDICLVATSANRSGEPLVIDDAEAARDLADIADLIAGHDRAIVTRADDSVGRIMAGGFSLVRRSRGYAPSPLPLAHRTPTVLALGGALKASVTVASGREAIVSQHVGDTAAPKTRTFLRETAAQMLALVGVRPERIACDAHPDFFSSQLADEWAEDGDIPVIAVQHHHAHVAAVLGEHGHTGPALGLALDGYGWGADGGAWGGELIWADGASWRRLGHFAEIGQPGGDAAAREPWRMAAAALAQIGQSDRIIERFSDEPLAPALSRLLAKGLAPATSSAGRYFDAAAGLLGVARRSRFEGEAAMRLEALARDPVCDPALWRIEAGVLSLDALMTRLASIRSPVSGANLFHGTLAAALVAWSARAAEQTGVRTVALAGGCFLNRTLTELVNRGLAEQGLTPLLARRVPPNDGGLSFGQAVVAGQVVL